MLLGGVAVGLIAGLLAGGQIGRLADVRLRWAAAIFLAVIVRFSTELALGQGNPVAEVLRLPLFAASFGLLAAGLWQNRRYPGILLALVGIVLNGTVIVWNGGRMPVFEPSLIAAGLTEADLISSFHILLPAGEWAEFLLRLGPFADVIPIPIPLVRNVASIGDVFLAVGLGFFLFATVVRTRQEAEEADLAGPLVGLAGTARLPRTLGPLLDRGQVRPETGLAPGLAEVAALERPRLLAGSNPALSEPALAPLQVGFGVQGPAVGIPRPAPELIERARRNPYVRLALNAPFSALWAGQVISLFGDRVHQVALAFLVYQATGSSIATAMVFLVATLPNLLFGPIAGTLVDRWDQKEVMVVSDLLRAACVLLVPVAAVVELWLVYPLVFLVTTISIFFRPARTAVLPRIVEQDDLLVANSATWIGETMADLIGYPLAAAFVALLGAAMPLAFWLDAATYVASAVLIGSVAVPPLVRTDAVGPGIRGVYADLRAGWEFLRRETVLLANTVQGVAGQFTLGILVAVTPLYCAEILTSDPDQAKIYYGLLETAIGVGNLLGGFLVGFVAAHLTKGRMVIVGYLLQGLTVAALAFVGEVATAMALLAGGGVANMLYVIASQTMFQERSPADMIGRVVGFRFALVFGSLTLAIGLAGIAVELVGIPPVLLVGGLLTAGAGVAGWFIPAVREA